MDKQKELLKAAWKKALFEGSVLLTFKRPADRHTIRFALYNAIRGLKSGRTRTDDSELLKAAEECAITLHPDGLTLEIRHIRQNEILQSLSDQLEIPLEPLEEQQPSPEAIETSAQSFLARMRSRDSILGTKL